MDDKFASVAFFDCSLSGSIVAKALEVSAEVGLRANQFHEEENPGAISSVDREIQVPYDDWPLGFSFYLSDNIGPNYPDLNIDLNKTVDATEFEPVEDYGPWMDTVFELVCRLSINLESAYVPLYRPSDRGSELPSSRPIGESVDRAPRFGVYSPTILEEFGGLDALFDSEPWYEAKLNDGRMIVIKSPTPGTYGEWDPPTEADYIEHAAFRSEA